ncbi:MAG: endolytic transglycosylase MltG [Taibaiella sp.]|nr:endolytic transglycosylase MltG [Taibaiella sp.]
MRKTCFGVGAVLWIVILLGLGSCHNPGKDVNVVEDEIRLFIPTGAVYRQVLDSLRPLVKDIISFEEAAAKMEYERIYPGRYTFRKGMTNEEMLNRLMLGQQDEIKITIGNYSSVYELGYKMEPLLRLKTEDIIAALSQTDEVAGMDTLKWIYCLAPDTYNFFWNVTGAEFVGKLLGQYKKFWTEERKKQLQSSGMTELQVISLASVVQLESYKADEQPKVAGLYLNRMRKGMKLDADPTVIFAIKQEKGWDHKVQRVYHKDLLRNSPYNTYLYKGIPPGPICMPNPSAIDAVLNPEHSDYIYFVADPERPGYHSYARTPQEHEGNAKKYRDWANKNNIK